MEGYVYRITNLINGKKYIGLRHWKNLETIETDQYMGSGKILNQAKEKYGLENFQKEILEIAYSEDDLWKLEAELGKDVHLQENYYNINPCGSKNPIMYGDNNPSKRPEVRRKISEKTKGVPKTLTCMQRNLMSVRAKESFKGRTKTKEDISKRSQTRKEKYGRYHSKEQLEKISETSWFKTERGKEWLKSDENPSKNPERIWGTRSEETKKKISESNRNVHHWWQDKINKNPEKIRKTAEKHKGMKRSEESRDKMRRAKENFIPSNVGKIWIHEKNDPKNKKFVNKNDNIPEGWALGYGKRITKE